MSDGTGELDNTWGEWDYQDDYGGRPWVNYAGQGPSIDLEPP